MYFTADNKVGIGTTDPETILDINGQDAHTEVRIGSEDGELDAIIRLIEARSTHTVLGGYIKYDGSGNKLNIGVNDTTDTANDDPRITIKRDTGAVGIGTTNPETILHVASTTDEVISVPPNPPKITLKKDRFIPLHIM